jgi:hypothetical protein
MIKPNLSEQAMTRFVEMSEWAHRLKTTNETNGR